MPGFACAPTWVGFLLREVGLCCWGRAGLAAAPLALGFFGMPGSTQGNDAVLPQRFVAVKWGCKISCALVLLTRKTQAPLQPLPHPLTSAHPSGSPQTLCPETEAGICRETKRAWLFGELEAEGAGLMPVNT